MLQNRVDPMGNIIRTAARGLWMGNRGVIHNDRQEIIRPFKLTAWITCRLAFKNWKRPVMAPKRYTELFFMDEATAFSAGHRPCSECRREAYNIFKMCWIKGNPRYGFNSKTLIRHIDDILQKERMDPAASKITYEEQLDQLPDGAFILIDGKPYLLNAGKLYHWSPEGYGKPVDLPPADKVTVLTPQSIVNTFTAGYTPQMAV